MCQQEVTNVSLSCPGREIGRTADRVHSARQKSWSKRTWQDLDLLDARVLACCFSKGCTAFRSDLVHCKADLLQAGVGLEDLRLQKEMLKGSNESDKSIE